MAKTFGKAIEDALAPRKRILVAEGCCRIKIEMVWPKGRRMSIETRPEGLPISDAGVLATKLAFSVHCGGLPVPKVSRTDLLHNFDTRHITKLLSLMTDDEYAAIIDRKGM